SMKKCAVLLLALGALVADARAQQPGAARLDASPQEIKRLMRDAEALRRRPVYQVTDRGVRVFDSEAERDRVLAQEAKERQALEESYRRNEQSRRAQQEARAEKARGKLGVVVAGLVIGLLLAIFGRR